MDKKPPPDHESGGDLIKKDSGAGPIIKFPMRDLMNKRPPGHDPEADITKKHSDYEGFHERADSIRRDDESGDDLIKKDSGAGPIIKFPMRDLMNKRPPGHDPEADITKKHSDYEGFHERADNIRRDGDSEEAIIEDLRPPRERH
ncbi:16105_t:CDS:10 [Acaulospora morrowiae]|uniref:16105_t:CDS:1 n=1 Tax=Acaulospora morrowiae TaxID=94023 RepID=A0A9N9BBK1_9GLOM|nr:16105_t:CDS:10 [Acaulospora morrowiae]